MNEQQRARIVHLASECEHSLQLAAFAAQRGDFERAAQLAELAEWDSSVAFIVASGRYA